MSSAGDLRGPTDGMVVVIAGPDGAGKTSLASALRQDLERSRGVLHLHYGARFLPHRSKSVGPVVEPHRHDPYPAWLSIIRLAYLFVDYALGALFRVRPFARRGGVVLVERGWWDLAVDPRRYRLQPLPRTIRFLGRLLIRPSVVFILEGEAEVLYQRKNELPHAELDRQRQAWRTVLPDDVARVFLNAERPLRDVLEDATRELSARAQLGNGGGKGWTALPTAGAARWVIPRAPRKVATNALSVYQPVTVRALLGWRSARLVARAGGVRLLSRQGSIPQMVAAAVGEFVPTGGTAALMRANHPGRYIVLLLERTGQPVGVAKVATDEPGRQALRNERHAIALFARAISAPLEVPQVLAATESALIFEPLPWRPRIRPWRLTDEVAFALGSFFASGRDPHTGEGYAHGDFTPWNLLVHRRRVVVIDWENAFDTAPPFHDLAHFLIASHSLLGRPSARTLRRGIHGSGWVANVIAAYATGAGVDASEARRWFAQYLDRAPNQSDRCELAEQITGVHGGVVLGRLTP